LSHFVGAYEVTPGWEFIVALRDSVLTIRSSLGGGAALMQAESPVEFFVPAADAEITFTRDAAGAVTGLVLHQYGRQRQAKKVR
jgi:hypothetical protein